MSLSGRARDSLMPSCARAGRREWTRDAYVTPGPWPLNLLTVLTARIDTKKYCMGAYDVRPSEFCGEYPNGLQFATPYLQVRSFRLRARHLRYALQGCVQ